MHEEEEAALTLMRDALKIIFGGVEMVNARFGPILNLEGWAADMVAQLPRYNQALARLYRKYYRRSSMSPEVELAMGIASSIGMHHCRKSFANSMASGMGFQPPTTEHTRSRERKSHVTSDVSSVQDDEEAPPSEH